MENQNENQQLLISFLTLRKLIGILGIVLPFVLFLGNFVIGKCYQVQSSISQYYYTTMGNVFVGILCAISVFLIAYKGYEKWDHFATNLAGFFSICVAFFPTSLNLTSDCTVVHLDYTPLSNLHYIAATLFFLTLACISFFLFTKSSGNVTPEKILRNRVYRICSIVIVISLLLILLYNQLSWFKANFADLNPVFWMETLALIAFGISWLTKGEFLLKDKLKDSNIK